MIALTAVASGSLLVARAFTLAVVGVSLVVPIASTLAQNAGR